MEEASMDKYMGSDAWKRDVEKARVNWKGGSETWPGEFGETEERWIPLVDEIADPLRDESIRYIEASADTGSRYVVVVTPLPPHASRILGATHLVSVVAPWQACYPMQGSEGGILTSSYVAEKLCGDRAVTDRLNGGDYAALTLTVAYALGREVAIQS